MTTVEYGEYLATAGGCRGCHGPDLAGAHCPNITPGVIGSWSETGFKTLLRKGVRPNGVQLSSEMPWQIFSNLTDEEITAIYLFVRSVPAKAPKKS